MKRTMQTMLQILAIGAIGIGSCAAKDATTEIKQTTPIQNDAAMLSIWTRYVEAYSSIESTWEKKAFAQLYLATIIKKMLVLPSCKGPDWILTYLPSTTSGRVYMVSHDVHLGANNGLLEAMQLLTVKSAFIKPPSLKAAKLVQFVTEGAQ